MQKFDYKKLKPVAIWLYTCAAAVFAMAIIGAITRLTESGLSIMEWKPITGALPPMSDQEWNRVFNLYKETSEFQQQHSWMNLDDFKTIFFWEWFHRLWGRLIGIIYAVPFFVFLAKGIIPQNLKPRFWGLLALGGLQGFMGWYMVSSGFADLTDVSHYRLAMHLGLAFIIFGCLLALAMTISLPPEKTKQDLKPLKRMAVFSLKAAFLTMVWGAFVAGLNAGLVYNEFPMMGAYPWPTEGMHMSPWWINLFENHATVQFIHRCLAVLTLGLICWTWMRARASDLPPRAKTAMLSVFIAGWGQVALGITTLLTQVHMHVAVMHQGGALIVFGALIWLIYELKGTKNV